MCWSPIPAASALATQGQNRTPKISPCSSAALPPPSSPATHASARPAAHGAPRARRRRAGRVGTGGGCPRVTPRLPASSRAAPTAADPPPAPRSPPPAPHHSPSTHTAPAMRPPPPPLPARPRRPAADAETAPPAAGRPRRAAAPRAAQPLRAAPRAPRGRLPPPVLVVALLLLNATSARAAFACAPTDNAVTCLALSDFYTATVGANWWNSSGWASAAAGTATPLCSFVGLGCASGGALTSMCARGRAARAGLPCGRARCAGLPRRLLFSFHPLLTPASDAGHSAGTTWAAHSRRHSRLFPLSKLCALGIGRGHNPPLLLTRPSFRAGVSTAAAPPQDYNNSSPARFRR